MRQNQCIRAFPDEAKMQHCKELLTGMNGQFYAMSSVFNLAGNEARLKILYLLHEEHNLCVCDLSDVLGMTASAVSQHLRKLKDGGIIRDRKEGQTVFYFITPEHDALIATLLQQVYQPAPA
jgi:DNA-binding transcriptional ArsR family regulator